MIPKKEPIAQYRDFSEMPADELREFANALAEISRKALEKESKKRRSVSSPSQDYRTTTNGDQNA